MKFKILDFLGLVLLEPDNIKDKRRYFSKFKARLFYSFMQKNKINLQYTNPIFEGFFV